MAITACEQNYGVDNFDNVTHVYHLPTCKIFTIARLSGSGKYRISMIEDDRDDSSAQEELERDIALDELNREFMPIMLICTEKKIGDIVYIVSHLANNVFDPSRMQ